MGAQNAIVTMGRTIATTALTAAQLQQLAAVRGQVRNSILSLLQQLAAILGQDRTVSTSPQLQQLAAVRGQVSTPISSQLQLLVAGQRQVCVPYLIKADCCTATIKYR